MLQLSFSRRFSMVTIVHLLNLRNSPLVGLRAVSIFLDFWRIWPGPVVKNGPSRFHFGIPEMRLQEKRQKPKIYVNSFIFKDAQKMLDTECRKIIPPHWFEWQTVTEFRISGFQDSGFFDMFPIPPKSNQSGKLLWCWSICREAPMGDPFGAGFGQFHYKQ